MKASRMLVALLLAMVFGSVGFAQDRIYKWTDADGVVHVSNRPPDSTIGAPPLAPIDAKDQALLDQLQQSLRDGDREGVVALFEYFEGLVGPRDAETDRQVVGHLLRLVDEEFGRPQALERVRTLSPRYVSAEIESASAEQWNASPCLFKSHSLKTVFAQLSSRQPVELVVTICTGPRIARPTLRQIEFRFVNPDDAIGSKVKSVLERTVAEARRLSELPR